MAIISRASRMAISRPVGPVSWASGGVEHVEHGDPQGSDTVHVDF